MSARQNTFPMTFSVTFGLREILGTGSDTDIATASLTITESLESQSLDTDTATGSLSQGRLLDATGVDIDASTSPLTRVRPVQSISVDRDTAVTDITSPEPLTGLARDIDTSTTPLTRIRGLTSGPQAVDNDFPQTFPTTFEDRKQTIDIDSSNAVLTRERDVLGTSEDTDISISALTRLRALDGNGDDPDAVTAELVVIAERLRGESVATGERQIISVAQGSID